MTGIGLVVLVLAVTTGAGLLWRRHNGRVRVVVPQELAVSSVRRSRARPAAGLAEGGDTAAVLASLGVDAVLAPVTLVQFSSAFCQPCRATRQVLGEVAALLPAVRHVEVDAESHLDAVRALGVLRTPTVLVVDGSGRVVRRASGLPRKADVVAAVAPYLG